MFSGILVDNHESEFRAELREINEDQLPELGVNVRVDYSTVNRKDARTIIGRPPIISEFPLVPGIDLAGTVESSAHPDYQTGDAILLNGCGAGVSHWGGAGAKSKPPSRVVGTPAGKLFTAPSYGDWHHRIYCHAMRHGAGKTRC